MFDVQLYYVLYLKLVLLVVCLFFVPQSPQILLSKGKEREARAALQWFRGRKTDCSEELAQMQADQKALEAMERVPWLRIVSTRRYAAPFGIVLVLMFLQQFSGINAIFFYVQTIFIDAGSTMDPGKR